MQTIKDSAQPQEIIVFVGFRGYGIGMLPTLDDLKSDFALLDDWQDRYRYVIDLGKNLAPMPEADRTEANRVVGCLSQVWLRPIASQPTMQFLADSDAHIVKGLIAILMIIYNNRPAADILATDIAPIFAALGMEEHLSVNRRNGFFAMVEKIKHYAAQAV
jgi:cysteine desulfuration protein SufE